MAKALDQSQVNPADLFASVGLMLDIESDGQLNHAWRVALVAYRMAQRVSAFEAPLVFIAAMLADSGALHFRQHVVHVLAAHPAVINQKAHSPLFFHPIFGHEFIRRLPGVRPAAMLVLQHHECINGSGYPHGLAGEEIELGAQILRFADQVDLVIRADRPESEQDILNSLLPLSGEDFAPRLLHLFEEMLTGSLPFGLLLQPERIGQEIEGICQELRDVRLMERDNLWARALPAISDLIDTRNGRYLQGHASQVARLADSLAERLDLTKKQREEIQWVSHLQNMGEVSLRGDILSKSSPLGEEERLRVRRHPVLGEQLIERVSGLGEVARIVRHHHENWDGSGYPDSLAGADIPLAARIVRVADSFTAMTCQRPYQRRRDWKQALKELRRQIGRQFDPTVVEATLSILSA